MLGRLVTARPPLEDGGEFEKTIWSLDQGGRDGVPGEFEYWGRRLGEGAKREASEEEGSYLEGGAEVDVRGDEWEIKVGDDEDMEDWFGQVTNQWSPENQLVEGSLADGATKWKELWEGLGRPVLKSDLLR